MTEYIFTARVERSVSVVETSRCARCAKSRLRTEQFPRKTGEMSEMLSALNDKRGAPRVSGAVNDKKPLTEEDKKNFVIDKNYQNPLSSATLPLSPKGKAFY